MKKIIALLILNIFIIYIVCAKSPVEVETPIVLEPDAFTKSGMFTISELNMNTSNILQAVDEDYFYIRTVSSDDTENVLLKSVYRVSRNNQGAKELVANYCIEDYEDWSAFYNGVYYSCETDFSMEQASITLLKYDVSEPEREEIIYSTPIDGFISIDSCGRYVVMAYTTKETLSESEGKSTTHMICYDLETKSWTEVMQCENTYKYTQDGMLHYTGEIVTNLGVSDEYITWVQLTVNDEPYQSDAGTASFYQYSIQDGSKERLFTSSRDVFCVWGIKDVIIATEYVEDVNLLENRGKLYFSAEGKWYEHTIPGISATAGMRTHEVHEIQENIYAIISGKRIYVYDLAKKTYSILDLDEATGSDSQYRNGYSICCYGDQAYVQKLTYTDSIEDAEIKFFQIDLLSQ